MKFIAHPLTAYLIATYCGGLVLLFTEPPSHGLPFGALGFLISPLYPLVMFIGLFSNPTKGFLLQSAGFAALALCVFVALRRLAKRLPPSSESNGL